MSQKHKPRQFVKAGETSFMKSLAKTYAPPTPAQLGLVEVATAIHEDPDAVERGFMARQLVLCTLPHSDPGDVPQWTRRTSNAILGIMPGRDYEKNQSIGYPYGSIPRLLLFWITTEFLGCFRDSFSARRRSSLACKSSVAIVGDVTPSEVSSTEDS